MRIRRILAAVVATAALAGLGLTGVATAATAQGTHSYVTPSECRQGGGTADLTDNLCKGGTHNGEKID
ncbi:hypothetical protein GCM10010260_70240 [Streptomyces filipinensis]|uniref:Uncharacterized protein n=1 Tax=Streptomyces filipinensis TaxID=66887 RepID=A0A918IHU1_9ACTN|nr:hypothetical protein [Streptomyces filipinensis]GGV20117.1 hypothetical protein GCM10010260_70240 [Streptomyces filipinensis]